MAEGNPYTPPAAAVADPVPAPRKRPLAVNIALGILGANLAMLLARSLLWMQDVGFHAINPLFFALTAGEYLLFGVATWQAALGRRWARTVLLVLALVWFAALCYTIGVARRYVHDLTDLMLSTGFILNRLLPVLANFIALHLLYFTGGSWFRDQQAPL